MAGWEKIRMTEMIPINEESRAGASQLAMVTRVVLTSSKTSPGTAKTFNSRAAREVAGAGRAWGGSVRIGGGSSIFSKGSAIGQDGKKPGLCPVVEQDVVAPG